MLNITNDEVLQEQLTHFVSALLPHEKYDPSMFSITLRAVFDYVHLDEMNMEYYVLFSIFNQLKEIQSVQPRFSPKLTATILEGMLNSQAFDLVKDPRVGMQKWSKDTGHKFSTENEGDLHAAGNRLYERVFDVYDKAFAMQVETESAMSAIPALTDAVLSNISDGAISKQAEIKTNGIWDGKDFYVGPMGWLEYTTKLVYKAKERISNAAIGVEKFESLDQANELKVSWKLMYSPLAYYNIKPLDASAPIYRHWLAIFCANEGVGKTAFSVLTAVSLLMANVKVLYMGGETTKDKVMARVVSHYIFVKYKIWITTEELSKLEELDDESRLIAEKALIEVVESGMFHFVPTLPYEGLYDKLKEYREKYEIQAVIIDHSAALAGGKNQIEDIGRLAIDCRRFKNEEPVYVAVCSHLSAMAKELLEKGKEVTTSPTKGNSTLSGEADEVMLFYKNSKLEKLGLVACQVTKTRGNSVKDIAFLRFFKEISTMVYQDEDQGLYSRDAVESEQMLEMLDQMNEEEESEYQLQ